MAKLESGIFFTGSIENLSAYKRKDSDAIILRKKGGASKNRIKKDPKFVNFRSAGTEFGGRATASKWIMQSLFPLKALADYNIAGSIIALLQPVQKMDTVSAYGERAVQLSVEPGLLAGFNLNRKNPFDTIIRNPIAYTLQKIPLKATVDIPALLPGINFIVPWNYPLFRIQVSLGIVPDLFYTSSRGNYQPTEDFSRIAVTRAETEWLPVATGSPSIQLQLDPAVVPAQAGFSVLLSVGICYGNIGEGGQVQQVKYAGAAKILATV